MATESHKYFKGRKWRFYTIHLLLLTLTLFSIACTNRPVRATMHALSNAKSDTLVQSKPYKAIVAFSNDPEPSEDWNAAFGKVMAAFKGSDVEVMYAMPEEKTLRLESGQMIDIDLIRADYNMGYAVFENGKAPTYVGDHAGFFDPDAPNPIALAKAYFEK